MAEGYVKKMAREQGMSGVTVASCGTAASYLFKVPKAVLALMESDGIDLSGHRSTQVNQTLVEQADLILVMEEFHREYLNLCFPGIRKKVYLFKEYVKAQGDKEIPDPIGHSEEFYRDTAAALKRYAGELVQILAKENA